MKFLITAVTMSNLTRRRRGKAHTEVIDTEVTAAYHGLTDPMDVEDKYEELHEELTQFEKVVDVRVITDGTL